VNTVINLPFQEKLGNSSEAERLAASQEELSSMKLVSYVGKVRSAEKINKSDLSSVYMQPMLERIRL
jgi:hypothetical protein